MPLCTFDSRGILQRPFWEQGRGRRLYSRLTTGASQHLSKRNTNGYRLCVVTMASQWRTFALTRRNQILSGPSYRTIQQSPSMNPCFQLSCVSRLTWLETQPYSSPRWKDPPRLHLSRYHDNLILFPFALFATDANLQELV